MTSTFECSKNGDYREVIAKAMTMKGIPKQNTSAIRATYWTSQQLQHKKMSGASNWEVSQLVKVIDSIDMRMSDFFDIYSYSINEVHDAIWNDGKTNIKCKIYLSNVIANDATEYSALKLMMNGLFSY